MMSLGSCLTRAPAKVLQAFQGDHHKSALGTRKSCFTASTWNICSMVHVTGPIEIATQRPGDQRGEDRKIDLIVHELATHNVSVGSLQETKWIGNEVCKVGDSVVFVHQQKEMYFREVKVWH